MSYSYLTAFLPFLLSVGVFNAPAEQASTEASGAVQDKRVEKRSDSAASVLLIRRDQIEKSGATTVGDVLMSAQEAPPNADAEDLEAIKKIIERSTDEKFNAELVHLMRKTMLDRFRRVDLPELEKLRKADPYYYDQVYLPLVEKIVEEEVTAEKLQFTLVQSYQAVLTKTEIKALSRLTEMPEWRVFQEKQGDLNRAMMQGGAVIAEAINARIYTELETANKPREADQTPGN
jgi:hypothetical protein